MRLLLFQIIAAGLCMSLAINSSNSEINSNIEILTQTNNNLQTNNNHQTNHNHQTNNNYPGAGGSSIPETGGGSIPGTGGTGVTGGTGTTPVIGKPGGQANQAFSCDLDVVPTGNSCVRGGELCKESLGQNCCSNKCKFRTTSGTIGQRACTCGKSGIGQRCTSAKDCVSKKRSNCKDNQTVQCLPSSTIPNLTLCT